MGFLDTIRERFARDDEDDYYDDYYNEGDDDGDFYEDQPREPPSICA